MYSCLIYPACKTHAHYYIVNCGLPGGTIFFCIIALKSRFSENLTEHKIDTWIFSTDFRDIPKYQISWRSVHWEPSCSMRTDKRTDRHDGAKSRFSQFCESA